MAAVTDASRAEQAFTMSRVFDAPRALVFKACTERERLAQWWGPKGFEMLACTLDLRPGGLFHYGLRAPNGTAMWGKWVFREVVAPERLVFVASFSDEEGGETRHPWSAQWPLEVLSTITFAERDGQTTLTFTGIPVNATDEERATFAASHAGMQQGWTGTLDQLAAYLAKA
jgi:uncharacterized protein YndB with AHSA1/START domain